MGREVQVYGKYVNEQDKTVGIFHKVKYWGQDYTEIRVKDDKNSEEYTIKIGVERIAKEFVYSGNYDYYIKHIKYVNKKLGDLGLEHRVDLEEFLLQVLYQIRFLVI